MKRILLSLLLIGFSLTGIAQAPTITSFTPASGPPGTLVTITGTNLGSPTTFSIGGVSAVVISNTGSSLLAMVMPGAVTGNIFLNKATGSITSSTNFIVTPTPVPNIQQGNKLLANDNTGLTAEGYSVAMSADGNTALVGGYQDNNNQGAAWVYTRSGGVWTQQGTKLVGTGSVGMAYQGTAVSLSADGNTALVGGYSDNNGQGATWVFTRNGSTWLQQGTKLVGTGGTTEAYQGYTVSISADGNTAITGGFGDNTNMGATWVFTRSGTTWTQQGTKLVGTGGIGTELFQGYSVAISADGNTIIESGVGDNNSFGAVWIFTRSGNTWTQQGSKLVGTGSVGSPYQGYAVSINADGNTAIVGGYQDDTNIGAAWVFTRSGTTWTQQGNKLVGTGATAASFQGNAVSLSADGNTAIIGAPGDNIQVGAFWLFARSGSTWTQQGNKLVGTGSVGDASHGLAVAISADGTTMIDGGYKDNNNGAVWMFRSPSLSSDASLSALAISAGTLSPVFGTNTITYTASVGSAVNTITVTPTKTDINATIAVQINGGGYATVVSGTASSPLTLSSGANTIDVKVIAQDGTTIKTYTITVTKVLANQAITFAALANSTYGDADFNLTASGGASGNAITYVSSNTLVATVSGNTVTILTAGTTNITASQAGNTDYNAATDVIQPLTVNKKTITVTAEAKSKIYGDADPALTYSSTPALKTGDSFTGAISRTTGEDVGAYTINQNTLALSINYVLNYTDADLTIGTKTISVTAEAKSKTYGDADPALTYIATPALKTGDSFTGAISRTTGEDVGAYSINQNTLALSTNYILDYTDADLTIGTKTITVTAEAKSKIYGDADPALTYIATPALKTGDSFTGAISRTIGEDVGAYSINQNTLALSINYVLNYTDADLTIGTKTITVTAEAKSKTYGDADPTLTYIATPALKTGDSFTGAISRTTGENVGAYSINQNTLALSTNYILDYTDADLTIGTKTITVTAEAKSKTYGDADPALTYSSTPALKTGDSFTGAISRTTGENVGAYTINQNTLALSTNYVLNYTDADLTIGTKTISVTADPKSKTYGDADPVLTYIATPALKTGDSFTGVLNRATGESVGAYAINRNTLALSSNYTLNYTGADLSISAKTITVSADPKSKTYGDTDPALTYTATPALKAGDSFTGSLKRVSGEDVNTYTINQNTLALSTDYILNYSSNNLTITKKSLTISADNKNRVFGVTNPVLSASYTGFAGTDNKAVLTTPVALTTTATISSSPGSYPIIVNGATALNYDISFVDGTLNITANTQSISFSALADKLTTDGIFTLTATATSGLAITYTSSDVSIARIVNDNQVEILKTGTVSITASQPGNGNYTAAIPVMQQLIIHDNLAPVIVIASNRGNRIGKGETAILTATGADTYQWATANGIISGQNTYMLTVRPSATSIYTVTGTNQYGRSSTQTFTLEVSADIQLLDATNILTPNGDGINDYWIVKNIDMYPNNELKIFDRSGRIVYTRKGYDNSWGATFNGAPLAEGTYYYIINFGDGVGIKKGFITVIRK